jgi:7-cyano-7-deazaguanine synthase
VIAIRKDLVDMMILLHEELDAPIDATWSCYRGGEHPCGCCGACVTRGRAGA